MSFGFKYGMPIDADIVMDVRFLPNPFYIPELRPFTGLDKRVFDYVMNKEETQVFYKKLLDMLETAIPGYIKEGKEKLLQLVVLVGNTVVYQLLNNLREIYLKSILLILHIGK